MKSDKLVGNIFFAVFSSLVAFAAWVGFATLFFRIILIGRSLALEDYILVGGFIGIFMAMLIAITVAIVIGVINLVGAKIWGNKKSS